MLEIHAFFLQAFRNDNKIVSVKEPLKGVYNFVFYNVSKPLL